MPVAGLAGVGVPPAPVQPVEHHGLRAYVSPSHKLGPEPTGANTLAHHRVLSAIMAQETVVPIAFGHVLPPELLERFLLRVRPECEQLLGRLNDRIEVGLKLIWRKERFLEVLRTPEINRLAARIKRARPRERDALEARLGEQLQLGADRRRDEYTRTLFEPLASRAVDARLSDNTGPRMAMNAAFLINRSHEAAFDQLVNQLCQPLLSDLDVRYSGPWPPYSFVSLRVSLKGDA